MISYSSMCGAENDRTIAFPKMFRLELSASKFGSIFVAKKIEQMNMTQARLHVPCEIGNCVLGIKIGITYCIFCICVNELSIR